MRTFCLPFTLRLLLRLRWQRRGLRRLQKATVQKNQSNCLMFIISHGMIRRFSADDNTIVVVKGGRIEWWFATEHTKTRITSGRNFPIPLRPTTSTADGVVSFPSQRNSWIAANSDRLKNICLGQSRKAEDLKKHFFYETEKLLRQRKFRRW